MSQRTASRILSGGSPRSKNAKKVFEAARLLGYVRNQQAANLKSGFSRVIGVVVPNFDKPYHARLIQGLHDEFRRLDYPILVWCTDEKDEDRATVLERLLSYQVAGVFVDQSNHDIDEQTEILYRRFLSLKRPLIIAGTLHEKIEADYVHVDTQRAIANLVEFHARCGRRRIALLSGPKDKIQNVRRYQYFKDELKRLKIEFREEYCSFGEETEDSAYTRFLSMLRYSEKLPDAVIGSNDILAAGIMRACHDDKIPVPNEIAVSGSGDIPMGRMLNPALTTIRLPLDQMVKDIVELMDYRISNKDLLRPRVLKYMPELVVRESA